MNHKLEVCFLGQFKIVLDGEKTLCYEDIGSVKNAKFLAYLLKNYRVQLSGAEIQNVMFSDESSSNPANALKALVYRLRTTLKKAFGDVDIISSGKSTYYINSDIDVILDIDLFNQCMSDAETATDENMIVECFEKAVQLYKGSFLSELSEEQWVAIAGTYLESSYLTAVVYLLKRYLQEKRYSDIEKLSTTALNYDSLNENLHYYLLVSLIKQNKMSIAKKHYLDTEKVLYDELGVYPNDDLQSLYSEILSNQGGVKEATMSDVQQHLVESKFQSGAFQCSYDTFRKIYQLEARKAMRRGNVREYIVLLTIEANDFVKKNPSIIDAIIESTSSLLCQNIMSSLRAGDTFAKYSNSQYVILLPDCTDENARRVVERIVTRFYGADKYERVKILSKIDEIRLAEVGL